MEKWLIVDDDTEDQEIFEIALTDTGASVELVKANNGSEAIELLKNSDNRALPDIIFLDLNMTKMDGRECIAELKKMDFIKDIPVYIYTTSSDSADIEQLKTLGAKRFITKPSNIPDLVNILKEIVLAD